MSIIIDPVDIVKSQLILQKQIYIVSTSTVFHRPTLVEMGLNKTMTSYIYRIIKQIGFEGSIQEYVCIMCMQYLHLQWLSALNCRQENLIGGKKFAFVDLAADLLIKLVQIYKYESINASKILLIDPETFYNTPWFHEIIKMAEENEISEEKLKKVCAKVFSRKTQ